MATNFVFKNDEYDYSDSDPFDDQSREKQAIRARLCTFVAHSGTRPDRRLPPATPADCEDNPR